jgi:hypothetical protein
MDAPLFDDHLGFPEDVEDLTVKAFISQFAIERLAVTVLPE